MDDTAFREHLVDLLEGGHAHVSAEQALKDINPDLRHARAAAGTHSIWEELEHMRIAQEDILQYALDPSWKSPAWPDGYWPVGTDRLTDQVWAASVSGFMGDVKRAVALVRDPRIDLTAVIPHTASHTILREVFLIADHNAYHLGQIVQTRKILGDWRP